MQEIKVMENQNISTNENEGICLMFLKNVKAGRLGRNFNLEEKNYFSICLPTISQRKIEQMHV